MQAIAVKAYGQVTQRTASGRTLEYTLFEQITHELEIAQTEGKLNPGLWGGAIYRNLQLWNLIASDLLHPDNMLPIETRSGLISLSEFIRRTSMDVLAGSNGLSDIIEVNRTIMAGLAQVPMATEGGVV